jgi:hypothetical protein
LGLGNVVDVDSVDGLKMYVSEKIEKKVEKKDGKKK